MKYMRCNVCSKVIDHSVMFESAYTGKRNKKYEYPVYQHLKATTPTGPVESSGYVCSKECETKFKRQFEKEHGLQQAKRVEQENRQMDDGSDAPVCSACGKESRSMVLSVMKFDNTEERLYACSSECEKKLKADFVEKHGLGKAETVSYDHDPYTYHMIRLLATYTKQDEKKVWELVQQGPALVAEEWRKFNPTTRKEKLDFYKQCENYLYDLTLWHTTGARLLDEQLAICVKELKPKRVLDFGAGLGDNSINIGVRADCDVVATDLTGKTFDFCKWRINKIKLDKKITTVPLDEPYGGEPTGRDWLSKQKFDVIVAMDVLEHLNSHYEVEETVMWFKTMAPNIVASLPLSQGGGAHPMHLTEDDRLKQWVIDQGVMLL